MKGTGGDTHCSSMAMATAASVMANWSPTHLRMPPPKGMNAKSDDTSFGYSELPWAVALHPHPLPPVSASLRVFRVWCPPCLRLCRSWAPCVDAGKKQGRGGGGGATGTGSRGRQAHEREFPPCGDPSRTVAEGLGGAGLTMKAPRRDIRSAGRLQLKDSAGPAAFRKGSAAPPLQNPQLQHACRAVANTCDGRLCWRTPTKSDGLTSHPQPSPQQLPTGTAATSRGTEAGGTASWHCRRLWRFPGSVIKVSLTGGATTAARSGARCTLVVRPLGVSQAEQ